MTQQIANPVPEIATAPGRRRSWPSWLRIFAGGLALWLATVVITFLTGNANLIPAVILLGSFLIPATFVTYVFGRADEVVTARRIVTAFVYGGMLSRVRDVYAVATYTPDQSAGVQESDGALHGGERHVVHLGQCEIRRQFRPGGQPSAADLLRDVVGDVADTSTSRRPRAGRPVGQCHVVRHLL
jgi:hypothetical protein